MAFVISKFRQHFSWGKAAIILLFLVGILLRLRQYLTGRSLWADEAMLALNIVNRTFGGMLHPLDYNQGAPIGFLLVEKLFNLLLGRGEYALRLFPLLMGILSLWLFYLLLKRVTSGAGLITAFALFALNPALVYYSSEVKQYILDVTMTTAVLLVAAPLLEARYEKRDFAWLAAAGCVALWFSHPAVFVLAGIGLTLAIVCLSKRDITNLWYTLGMGILWSLTIGLLYLLVLKDLQQNAYMREYWQDTFFPFPPWNDQGWLSRSLDVNIGMQFGIPYAVYLVFGLMLAGWFFLWKTKRDYAIAFGWILLVTLVASAMLLYPVFERMILFLVPIGLILIGKTVEAIEQRIRKPRWAGQAAALALAGLLIFGPLMTSGTFFIKPRYRDHIRPTMQALQDAWRPGDTMYLTNGAVPAFEFYAPFYGLSDTDYIHNIWDDYKNPSAIKDKLETLKGKPRVWVLMSLLYDKGGFNEKEFVLDYLKQNGKMKREFRVPGTSVYLYLFDMRE